MDKTIKEFCTKYQEKKENDKQWFKDKGIKFKK